MGTNWNNVLKDQMRGMDPVSAFYKEQKRLRDKRAKEYRELVDKKNEKRRSQMTKCTETGI